MQARGCTTPIGTTGSSLKPLPGGLKTRNRLILTQAQCEADIKRGLADEKAAWQVIGRALREIRDERLYKKNYSSFEEYCQKQWDMSVSSGKRYIEAVNFVDSIGSDVSHFLNKNQALTQLKKNASKKGSERTLTR